jgi:hypothetical protein
MMSVPRSALHFKVRKAVPDQRQSASYRFMPELRPVETTGIPLYGHPAWLLLRHISAFCPQLSFPGRRRHGQTVTHSACAVRRVSGMSQSERVPFLFARQTVSFTRPSRQSFYQMPFIQAAGQFLFYLRLLPAVIPCLPPHRFYRVRM